MVKKLIVSVVIPVGIFALALLTMNWMNSQQSGPQRNSASNSSASSTPAANAGNPSADQNEPRQRPDLSSLTDEQRETLRSLPREERRAYLAKVLPDQGQKSDQEAKPSTSSETNNRGGRRGSFSGRGGFFGAQAESVVAVLPAQLGSWAPEHVLYGTVVANQQQQILANISSEVVQVLVVPGQTVKSGETLIKLDTTDLQTTLAQQNARLDEMAARIRMQEIQAKTEAANLDIEKELVNIAKNSLARYENLSQQQLSANIDYDNALKGYQSQLLSLQNRQLAIALQADSLAQLNAQRQELTVAANQTQAEIESSKIVAPWSGTVAQVSVESGQFVTVNQMLLQLFDPKSLGVDTKVPVSWVHNFNQPENINARYKPKNQSWSLSLLQVDSLAHLGTVKARFIFDDSPTIPLGRTLSIDVSLPVQDDVFVLPATSVYGNEYVYTVEEGKLQQKRIQVVGLTQREDQTWYLLASTELQESDRVLTTRLPHAAQDLPVKLAGVGG